MSFHMLSEDQWRKIDADLADTVSLKIRASRSPVFASTGFPPESDIPIAAVCFSDSAEVLCGVRFALLEYYGHSKYLREIVNPPNIDTALFIERFYLDDAAHRLYAAAECLAKAITFMLGITEQDLKQFRKSNKSLQGTVGRYLSKKLPEHSITKAILRLALSRTWFKARKYRDEWVHEQAPPIQGAGFIYPRRKYWERTVEGSWSMRIGLPPQPTLTIEELHGSIRSSFDLFVSVFTECIEYYEARLREAGFTTKRPANT